MLDSLNLKPVNKIKDRSNISSRMIKKSKNYRSSLSDRDLNKSNLPYLSKTTKKLTNFFFPFQKDIFEERKRQNQKIKRKLIKLNQDYSVQKSKDKVYLKNLVQKQKIYYDDKYGKLKNELKELIYFYKKKKKENF